MRLNREERRITVLALGAGVALALVMYLVMAVLSSGLFEPSAEDRERGACEQRKAIVDDWYREGDAPQLVTVDCDHPLNK